MWKKPNHNVLIFADIVDKSLVNVKDIAMSLPDPTVSQEDNRLSATQKSFDIC